MNQDAQQRVSNDFLFLANPAQNAAKLGGTERAILSAVGLVVMLSIFKPTRTYAVWAGAVILIFWGDILYHKISGA